MITMTLTYQLNELQSIDGVCIYVWYSEHFEKILQKASHLAGQKSWKLKKDILGKKIGI